MPPRKRKTEPAEPAAVEISIEKVDGDYHAYLVGAKPMRMTFASTIAELPEAVSHMLGFAGYTGEVRVTWSGGDDAGTRAAKRLNNTASRSEAEPV